MSYGIAVNIAGVDSCLRLGSKAWLVMSSRNSQTAWVLGRTRGGRLVEKAVPMARLGSARVQFVPDVLPARVLRADTPSDELLLWELQALAIA